MCMHPIAKLSKEQMRLLYIKDGEGDDPIVCGLHRVKMSSKFRYVALSYCWCEPIFDKSISLNGVKSCVWSNLFDALKRLRKHFYWVWVDQVCINQQDLAEKSAQVSVMHSIYSRADKVISYLGEEGPDTKFYLQWLCELRRVVLGKSSGSSFERSVKKA